MTNVPNQAGLNRIDRTSIKDLALEQLKRYIMSGAVQPGQRLPSERDLAERLGVGRSSVREALKVLEAVGLIETRVGDGTYIVEQTGANIARVIGLSLATWGGAIVELLEARRIIEPAAAQFAATRATDADLTALGAALQAMEAADTFPTYLAADMQFHRLVAQATHNTLVARLIANLIDMLEETLRAAHGDELSTAAEGDGTHREVLAAIERHDGTGAADAMLRHLQFSTELWQAVVSLGTATADGE